jgi:hypothetical protein
MLKTHPHAEVIGESPIETDMACELEIIAEIFGAEEDRKLCAIFNF